MWPTLIASPKSVGRATVEGAGFGVRRLDGAFVSIYALDSVMAADSAGSGIKPPRTKAASSRRTPN
jgi:hypothetical protein